MITILSAVTVCGLLGAAVLFSSHLVRDRCGRRQQRMQLERARWLAEMRLQHITQQAMRRLLNEARRS